MKEKGKLSAINYTGYALVDVGNSLAFSIISAYLARFYTNILQIGVWATIIMVVARIWDGINDPIMGVLVQNAKPRKSGKYKPYLLIGGIPLALVSFLVFCKIPNLSTTGYIVYAFVTYIAYGMLYTVLLVPYGSLAGVMTLKENERSLLSVARSIGGGVGSIPGGILFPALVFVTGASGVSEMSSSRLMMVMAGISVFMVITYFIGFSCVKENVPPVINAEKIGVLKLVKSLVKDKVFVIMSLVGCFLIASNMYSQTCATYLFPDYFGKSGMMMVYTVVTYSPLVLIIVLVNKISEKIGKKEFIVSGLVLSTIFSFLLWVIHTENIWVYIAMNFVINAGVGFLTLEIWALALDIVDSREYETGLRQEAATYSSFTFMRKVGQAIAALAPSILLAIGYDTETGGEGLTQTSEVLKSMYNVSTFVPFLMYALMLALMIFYPLNKKKMIEIHETLDERRGQNNE